MTKEEADIIREQMREYIRLRLGGTQQRLAEKLGCQRENLSNFLTGATGTMRKGRIEKFQKMYQEDIVNGGLARSAQASELIEDYDATVLRELQEAEIESIVGRIKQLIVDLESPGLDPWVKFSQLARVFKGVTDEFISVRKESSKTTAG